MAGPEARPDGSYADACRALDSRRPVEGVAERDDVPGIGGLLRLDGDLRDAAGLVQRERGRRLAAQRPGELREDVRSVGSAEACGAACRR